MCTQELPYEKFLREGPGSLSDAELLAIILRTGTRGENTVSIASRVLQLSKGRQRGILGLHHLTLQELMSIRGIGEVKAIKLKCIAELSNRISRAAAEERLVLTSPESVAAYYMERLRHEETEQVILIMMDGRNHLLAERVISKGTANASLVSAREVFRTALQNGAVYLMLLHNHPGGDPAPGKQDRLITERLQKAAALIEIPLIDHIIIGDKRYFSFREMGYL